MVAKKKVENTVLVYQQSIPRSNHQSASSCFCPGEELNIIRLCSIQRKRLIVGHHAVQKLALKIALLEIAPFLTFDIRAVSASVPSGF